MRILAAIFAALLLATPATAQIISPSEMLRSSVTNFIRPQTKAFATRTTELSKAMYVLCENGDLTGAQEAFSNAATAYGRMEFLRVGPLMEGNRVDRILFFPDRKGIGLRQVQQLLAEADLASATVPGLQQKSIAVQGFGALEFVLFGTGFETLTTSDGAFRCAYGAAIAKNLEEMAGDIAAGWADPEGIAKRLTQPDPAYADYRTTTESLEALVGLVSHGIEAVRDTRINPFIAKGDGKANPKQALFWRSNQTLPMLRANLDGLRRLIELSGIVTDPALSLEITAAFARAEAAIVAVTSPVEEAVADPAQSAALADLVTATQDLQRLIGEDLSATLGLSVGFSSLDGD
jgi:predicted lipoprotein